MTNNHPEITLTDDEQENRINAFNDALTDMPAELKLLFWRIIENLSKFILIKNGCTQLDALKYSTAVVGELFYRKMLESVMVEYFVLEMETK